MHESATARWNEVIVEEQVEFRPEPLFTEPIRPLEGPVPEDVVVQSGRVLQYEPAIRVRLPGANASDVTCGACQGRRWVGDPSNPQECACAAAARPREPRGMPSGRLTQIAGEPGLVGDGLTGLRVGDRLTIQGRNGPVVGIVTSVNNSYEGGRHSNAVTFAPVELVPARPASTNPCAEIDLGGRPVGRVMQAPTWSELEIATLRSILGEDVDLRPGSLVRSLIDASRSEGVDLHELTRRLITVDGLEEAAKKLAEAIGAEAPPRTRFERDEPL